MRCPSCQSLNTRVIDGKRRLCKPDGSEVWRRRRECRMCSKRFNTYEDYEPADLEASFKLADIDKILHSTK